MTLGEFKKSKAYSMGVELELQLINLDSFDLTSASPKLISLLKENPFPGNVTPEITESMIEVCTDVMTSYSDLKAQLESIRNLLVAAGDELNIGICGGGTHPFQKWSERRIYDKQRYKQLSELYGYLAKQFTVFGQHVHIGCESGDDALYLLHSLSKYIPHFIALSASSPFIQGSDTNFDSARLNSVFAFPLSGHAPFILNWEEFDNEYFAKMNKTGTVNSMKDFYWDLRPKPEYGTVELRVCDTPLSVEKAAVIAAYLQAVCFYILDERCSKLSADDYLVYNYNRFQACRFGMDGIIVDPKTYEHVGISESITATIEKIRPYAQKLGSEDALELIQQYINNDASEIRHNFYVSGENMKYVINDAMAKFRQ